MQLLLCQKHRFDQSRGMLTASAIEKVLLTSANGAFQGIPDEFNQLGIQLQMLPDMTMRVTRSLIRTICDVMNAIPACKTMLNVQIVKLFAYYTSNNCHS